MSTKKHSYTKQELIACSQAELFGIGQPVLPSGPMLMIDRVTNINDHKGNYNKGEVCAELDIKPDMWFFQCHFIHDPVMPGCLGLDAMWQLIGFYLAWLGHSGKGRAIGCGEVKFADQVLPLKTKIMYHVHIKRVIQRSLTTMASADATVEKDGKIIYTAKNLKVGVFKDY